MFCEYAKRWKGASFAVFWLFMFFSIFVFKCDFVRIGCRSPSTGDWEIKRSFTHTEVKKSRLIHWSIDRLDSFVKLWCLIYAKFVITHLRMLVFFFLFFFWVCVFENICACKNFANAIAIYSMCVETLRNAIVTACVCADVCMRIF